MVEIIVHLLGVSIFPRKLNHIIRPLALALQQEPLRVPLYLHHLEIIGVIFSEIDELKNVFSLAVTNTSLMILGGSSPQMDSSEPHLPNVDEEISEMWNYIPQRYKWLIFSSVLCSTPTTVHHLQS